MFSFSVLDRFREDGGLGVNVGGARRFFPTEELIVLFLFDLSDV